MRRIARSRSRVSTFSFCRPGLAGVNLPRTLETDSETEISPAHMRRRFEAPSPTALHEHDRRAALLCGGLPAGLQPGEDRQPHEALRRLASPDPEDLTLVLFALVLDDESRALRHYGEQRVPWFSVEPNEIVGIVGESGSGKSLTLQAVLDLLPRGARVSGELLWLGRDLGSRSPAERRALLGRDLALVSQDPGASLHPAYTVVDQVAEAVTPDPESGQPDSAREKARQLLGELGTLQDDAHEYEQRHRH